MTYESSISQENYFNRGKQHQGEGARWRWWTRELRRVGSRSLKSKSYIRSNSVQLVGGRLSCWLKSFRDFYANWIMSRCGSMLNSYFIEGWASDYMRVSNPVYSAEFLPWLHMAASKVHFKLHCKFCREGSGAVVVCRKVLLWVEHSGVVHQHQINDGLLLIQHKKK